MGGVANQSLKSLIAGALNAQDAAFRYEYQTSSLQEAKSSSKISTYVESGPSPVELCHSSAADAGKATEVQAEEQIVSSSGLTQVRCS